jgi:hypothetical protein
MRKEMCRQQTTDLALKTETMCVGQRVESRVSGVPEAA